MKKEEIQKIFSFMKEWKKSFIALGIFLLLVIVAILNLVATSSRSFSGMSKNALVSESIGFGSVDNFSEPQGVVMKNDMMPIRENKAGKYDKNIERKIIKNGNLSLVVVSIDNAKENINKITKKYDGFIQSSNFRENEDYQYWGDERRVKSSTKSGYFELKIPSKNFEAAFSDYKKIALKVNNESVSGRDVTEEYLDLESQIKNKQAEVNQYRKILESAKEIKDILEVTKYLNSAQSELDRKQGRLNYLSNQVELSSIRIDIVSEKDVEVFGVVWSPLTEIKEGFSNMLGDLRDFSNDLIALIFKLPWLILNAILWIFGFYIIYKIFVMIKRKIWDKK